MSKYQATWLRRYQRYAHLLFGAWLGVVIYSPLGEEALALLVTRAVVFPLLVVSGLLLWKGPTLRRRLSG